MGKSYRDLVVWQKSMDLVAEVYQVTSSFPKNETYLLTSQLRRAAVSVPSNIAEGQGRRSPREFAHFLRIAAGSLMEAETQVLICLRLGYVDESTSRRLLISIAEIGRLLHGLTVSQAHVVP